jgi:hypothetical protein
VDTTPVESSASKVILRRVGKILIVVGVADIALMMYIVSSGQGYSSSFNIFAVIAGVLLRRHSLQTARIVRVYAAFMFAGFLGVPVVLFVVFPRDLIQTYLRIAPVPQVLGWSLCLAAVLALLWWVYHSLSAPAVEAAIQASELSRSRYWHHPWAGFVAGAGLAALLAIVLPLTNQSEDARRAVEQARVKLGPGYQYFVSSLSTSWSSAAGAQVRASVLAYTESSIQFVELEWHE